jgi:hypothetical protein
MPFPCTRASKGVYSFNNDAVVTCRVMQREGVFCCCSSSRPSRPYLTQQLQSVHARNITTGSCQDDEE